jgi:hypothetical protein
MKKLSLIAMSLVMGFAISTTSLSAKCGDGKTDGTAQKACCKKSKDGKMCCKKSEAKTDASKKEETKKSN